MDGKRKQKTNKQQVKKMRFLLFAMLFSFSVSGQLQLPQDSIRFLALGDSYTIGQSVAAAERWPAQLGDSLASRGYDMDTVRVIATTGWRTDNLINALKGKNLESLNYNLVSLLIGVNNQYQGRPFIQYAGEFPALLDSAVRYAGGDRSRVFVVSIPDYAYTPFGQQSSNPGKISMELDKYNEFSKHIADSMHITYFDITPISRLGLTLPSYVANDGLHPSGIQYAEWVKLMLALIDLQLTGFDPRFPDHPLDITISPNPASGRISFQIHGGAASQPNLFRIYNLNGELLHEEKVESGSGELDVRHLPEGLCMLQVISGEQVVIKQLFVNNF